MLEALRTAGVEAVLWQTAPLPAHPLSPGRSRWSTPGLTASRRPGETSPRGASSEVKVREVIRLLQEDGWTLVVTRGNHRQFKHPTKPGRVTVSGNLGDDMPKGTFGSVTRQAGLKGRPA